MKETNDKIVVFGQSNYRFDIPKSHIIAVGRNVILDMDFPEIFKYQVDRNAPLPTGEPIEKLIEEAYSEDYNGPKEEDKSTLVHPKKIGSKEHNRKLIQLVSSERLLRIK
jgi:hypothetical protein